MAASPEQRALVRMVLNPEQGGEDSSGLGSGDAAIFWDNLEAWRTPDPAEYFPQWPGEEDGGDDRPTDYNLEIFRYSPLPVVELSGVIEGDPQVYGNAAKEDGLVFVAPQAPVLPEPSPLLNR